MLKLQLLTQRFESEELDRLFELSAEAKRPVNHYSERNGGVLDHHSVHHYEHMTLTSDVSGTITEDLKFQIKKDTKGYLFKLRIGELNEATVKIMNVSLKGVLSRLKDKEYKKKNKLTGFRTDHLDGIYFWGINPDEEALGWYQEAVELGEMSDDFRNLCISYNLSVKKFPET